MLDLVVSLCGLWCVVRGLWFVCVAASFLPRCVAALLLHGWMRCRARIQWIVALAFALIKLSLWFAVRGSRFAVCGSRFAVRGLRFAVALWVLRSALAFAFIARISSPVPD